MQQNERAKYRGDRTFYSLATCKDQSKGKLFLNLNNISQRLTDMFCKKFAIISDDHIFAI